MRLPKLKTKISVEEYLEDEKFSPVKHEYVYGEVYAMAGTKDNHNRIDGNSMCFCQCICGVHTANLLSAT
jgi:Uma2 family endonuclease